MRDKTPDLPRPLRGSGSFPLLAAAVVDGDDPLSVMTFRAHHKTVRQLVVMTVRQLGKDRDDPIGDPVP